MKLTVMNWLTQPEQEHNWDAAAQYAHNLYETRFLPDEKVNY